MKFTSETRKIPKGYGHIVKPSHLEATLRAAGVDIEVHLVRHHAKRLFDAHFWKPNPNVLYERVYITVGTVAAGELAEMRERVKRESIPQLVRWISGILVLDPNSPVRRESHMVELLPPRDVWR